MIDLLSTERSPVLLAAAIVSAALLSAALIVFTSPFLKAYALAWPNARSSHREATPQGGGIAVVAATLAVVWCVIAVLPAFLQQQGNQFAALTAATALLAVVGAVDDIRTLPALPRLVLQFVACGTLIAALPADWHLVPVLPWWLERIGLVIGLMWFINLVNFMDGTDWMTVVEVLPITGAIVLLGLSGTIAPLPMLVAAALLGATLGFAPFNRPVAKLFLGDVGSLPIGLLLGWLLLQLAANGHREAALLLPLYYLADATGTLIRRIAAGEAFWRAHRTHFYQRAVDRGLTVYQIVTRVFLVNVALAALALATVAKHSSGVLVTSFVIGAALVSWLLVNFSRDRS